MLHEKDYPEGGALVPECGLARMRKVADRATVSALKRYAAATVIALLFAPAAHAAYFDVARLPPPPVPGKEIADDVEKFSTDFPHRVGGIPLEQ